MLFPAAPAEGAEFAVFEPAFELGGLLGIGVCAVTHGAVPLGTVWFEGCVAGGAPVGLGAACVGAGVSAVGGGTGWVLGPAALVVIGVGGPIGEVGEPVVEVGGVAV